MNRPMQLIHAERKRQVEEEGWTAAHDDAHENGELLTAAGQYYLSGKGRPLTMRSDGAPVGWSWEAKWWKPKGAERDLVRAGALCLAERERIRRKPGGHARVTSHVDHKLTLIVEALFDLDAAGR